MAAARAMRAISPASFTSRSASTTSGGDQLAPLEQLGPAALPAPGDVAGLEADPAGAGGLSAAPRGRRCSAPAPI